MCALHLSLDPLLSTVVTLLDFIFPDFIRTDLIWNGPNSAITQSAEKRDFFANSTKNTIYVLSLVCLVVQITGR